MASLLTNEFVRERHSTLPSIMAFALFLSTILITIFTIYANNFIQKQRRQEYGLYTVLGLERKHISLMMLVEQVLIWLIGTVLATGIGYVIGKVLFILLNRLMKDTGAGLMDYPFAPTSAIVVMIVGGLIMFLIYLMNLRRVSKLSPSQLLQEKKAGEKEPKANFIVLLIGLITITAGYYLALTLTNALSQLPTLFGSILLIVLGTYCLFISLSIAVLKGLKKNKNRYYTPDNFLTISGMLYRMKANAVSLASIAILCTGIIVTVGTTLSLYMGMSSIIDGATPRDFDMSFLAGAEGEAEPVAEEEYLVDLSEKLGYELDAENVAFSRQLMTSARYSDGQLEPDRGEPEHLAYLLVTSLEDFNELHGTDYQLDDNQALFTGLTSDAKDLSTITLNSRNGENKLQLNLEQIDEAYMPSNYVGDILYMVLPDSDQIQFIQENYLMYSNVGSEEEAYQARPDHTLYFDLSDEKQAADVEQLLADNPISLTIGDTIYRLGSRQHLTSELYSLNGGFLFLGIVVGTVLTIGTVLMLYFKQISEGYDDQEKFDIMTQIGLPDDLIKATIRKQVFWIFALPSIVAVFNAIMAHKIVVSLLRLLGLISPDTIYIAYAIVIVIFLVIYALCYLLTSRMYYSIIKKEM
ncbi:ABC transporter permease [Aerococcaceae bacterium 50-4]